MRRLLEYWLARSVLATLAWGPRPAAERLALFYCRLLDMAVPRLRRVAKRNLSMAMPRADHQAIIDGVFRSIARNLTVFARFPQIHKDSIGDWIRYEGYEHFEQALARGKGVLFATAHLGAWELSAFSHALMSGPMYVVVRPLDNPLLDAFVERHRSLSGNHIVGKKDYARSILRALHTNQALGVLIDQNAGLDDGVFVDFFGIPASANAGFARLAAHSGATVIPGFALWSDAEQRFVLRFYPPVPMHGDLQADSQAIHSQLEGVIREFPDQWLWLHRRWKTRPPGQPDLYG